MSQDKAHPTPAVAVPSEEDKNYPFYELRFILRVLSHHGGAPKQDWQTAYGMAKAIFERWHKERLATPPSLPAAQAVEEAEGARHLSLELLGVITDVEEGRGFDDVCLETVKRVYRALAGGAAK